MAVEYETNRITRVTRVSMSNAALHPIYFNSKTESAVYNVHRYVATNCGQICASPTFVRNRLSSQQRRSNY